MDCQGQIVLSVSVSLDLCRNVWARQPNTREKNSCHNLSFHTSYNVCSVNLCNSYKINVCALICLEWPLKLGDLKISVIVTWKLEINLLFFKLNLAKVLSNVIGAFKKAKCAFNSMLL